MFNLSWMSLTRISILIISDGQKLEFPAMAVTFLAKVLSNLFM